MTGMSLLSNKQFLRQKKKLVKLSPALRGWWYTKKERKITQLAGFIPLLFCLHGRFIFDNRLTGEVKRSLFDILNSFAMCLAEFI